MNHPNPAIERLLAGLASAKLPAIDLSLARVEAMLAAFGNPQDRLPPVVHIAGTNGKGSLVAYLTAIFQAAGYRLHRYISPHLVRFNERIMLAGEDIDDERLLPLLAKVASYAEANPVTYFEATTVAAFLAFAETPADIVLLETGLGGRLDATNLVKRPRLTAITPVSMDHTEFLGETLAAIAREKAGILKAGVPCVVGPQKAEAGAVIEEVAGKLRVPLYRFGREWNAVPDDTTFAYRAEGSCVDYPRPNLEGAHQSINAATAVACIDRLSEFRVSDSVIRKGITQAVWPARLQRLTKGTLAEALPEGVELWLDGGHNPDAGVMLGRWAETRQKPVHLVCGMLKNKDTQGFLQPLAPHVASLTGVSIPGSDLGQSAQQIEGIAASAGITILDPDNRNKMRNMIESIVKHRGNQIIILMCGSLYLAGNILWQNSQNQR